MTRYEQLLENYEDALFALLMEKAAMAGGERILEENERLKKDPNFSIPSELDRACIKTINRAFRKRKVRAVRRVSYRVLQHAAVVIVAAILLFTTAFAVSETVRAATLNFISATFYDHMEIRFGEASPSVQQSNPLDFEVGWLPEGFELENQIKEQDLAWQCFTCPDGSKIDILTVIMDESTVMTVDTEDAEIENTVINGRKAQIIAKDYINIVIYIEEYACVMQISGIDVSREDLLKVAENVTF